MIREHLDKCAIVFIDDILISSWSREEHVEQLRIVLGKLGEHKLVANGIDVVLEKQKNWIFGSRVSEAGVVVYPEKIITSSEWQTPKRFIDLKCYYHWPRVKKKDVATLCLHIILVRWLKQYINYLRDYYTIYFFQIGNEIC